MILSVVIPTYGRGERLTLTLDTLLLSDTDGLDRVEVLVVDDGSPIAIAPIVEARSGTDRISLRCLRQDNAGPAKARNTGFRHAAGDIVLFIDDDIVCPPGLLLDHVHAHANHPQSVICGRCPLLEVEPVTPLFRFFNALDHDPGKDSLADFDRSPVVASGQISVQRAMFDAETAVYRDDLATPAAEEFELSLRLQDRGIPIWIANRIVAMHNHPINLESVSRQAYKHSRGCAEAAVKYPRTRDLRTIAELLRSNHPSAWKSSPGSAIKSTLRWSLSSPTAQSALIQLTRTLERTGSAPALLHAIYRAILSVQIQKGFRDGLRAYETR